ncbi:hypothetical protein U6G28_05270 [Actinomycetaceae bacterium MB13-C1-2]|nr:hypothetical protein U6G28_05270 [Actinomycetaceae bacterium MB13-C1-2]
MDRDQVIVDVLFADLVLAQDEAAIGMESLRKKALEVLKLKSA